MKNKKTQSRRLVQTFINPNVIEVIESELEYQVKKWGGRTHSVEGWILIMEKCLQAAKEGWYKEDHFALGEIRQVVAVGIACMSNHGAPYREPVGKTYDPFKASEKFMAQVLRKWKRHEARRRKEAKGLALNKTEFFKQ